MKLLLVLLLAALAALSPALAAFEAPLLGIKLDNRCQFAARTQPNCEKCCREKGYERGGRLTSFSLPICGCYITEAGQM